jgi:hypothetical protein
MTPLLRNLRRRRGEREDTVKEEWQYWASWWVVAIELLKT